MKAKTKVINKTKKVTKVDLVKARAKMTKANPPPAQVIEAPKPERYSSIRPPQQGASPRGYHRIEAKMLCDKRYQLAEVWKVRQPQYMTADPLAVGGLFHAGRAHWFESGFPTGANYWSELQHYIREAALGMELPVREDAISRTLNYLEQYCTYWSARAKPEVIGAEYNLSAPLIPGYDERTARLDDVGRYPEHGGKLCIGECKTTSVSVADVVNEYTVHGQTALQAVLWEVAENGAPMHGEADAILLDIIVKGFGKERCQFGRVPIRIPDNLKNWFIPVLAKHVKEAQLISEETDMTGRRNIINCTRQIGRMRVPCPYRDLCQRGKSAAPGYVDEKGTGLLNKEYHTKARPWD